MKPVAFGTKENERLKPRAAKKFLELKRGSFEGNEEIELWSGKLDSKEFHYAEFELEVGLKVVGGGIQYDPSEKGDVASHFRELAKTCPTLLDAIKEKGKDAIATLMPLFYAVFIEDDKELHAADSEGEEKEPEAPMELEFKPLEFTHKQSKGADEGYEVKMGLALHDRHGHELKAELVILENSPKEGLSGPKFTGGMEEEFKIKEDIPIGGGFIWTTPGLKFELGGELKPNWKKILEQVVKNLLTDVGSAGLVELGAASALVGVMMWAQYQYLQEWMALDKLPQAVPEVHEKLVAVVLDAFSNNPKPDDPFMAGFYKEAAKCSQKLKARVQKAYPKLTDDQYYEQVRKEIEDDRDKVVKDANLELKDEADRNPGYLDDLARQLAFVAFVKTARDAHSFPWTKATATRDGILWQAWATLFNEPPAGKVAYDKNQRGVGGRYRHDPHVYEEVTKELKLGTEVSGDLDQYIATEEDGLLAAAASMDSASIAGEVARHVDPLATHYREVVLDLLAGLDAPDNADDAAVYEKAGKRIREKMLAEAHAKGLDDATFDNGISAEVETERRNGRGQLMTGLWPRMQQLARIVLWLSYARSTTNHLGREGVWKGLFGKKHEDSPNHRLYDQVDDILKYSA